ncbi:MAG: type II toxin-antitoxin system VapC family toxin [Candidatus Bathyarchaeia archaeon]
MSYYVDTNIFLNVIYKEPASREGSARFLRDIQDGKHWALTSSVTLLEAIIDMAESGFAELTETASASIEDMRNLKIAALDKTMAKLAASYVIRDNLTVHDAYHLATALCRKAEAFVTRDGDLKKIISKYIKVTTPEEV